jgi:predicted membrane channel-forming protein YqfA (hemolysin III family)
MNIWSHVIGGILLLYWGFLSSFPVSLVFFTAALTCFLSATYHTLRNYSRRMYDICLTLDVASIGIQIFGAYFADLFPLFWESRPTAGWFFLISGILLCTGTIVSMPFLLRRKLYWIRTFIYSIESVLCIPVFTTKWLLDGFEENMVRVIQWRAACIAAAGLGIAVRSAHLPERFCQGTVFQSLLHSHFFFHLLSLASSYFSILSAKAFDP